eukprot:2454351-Rhodomonas_salina.3
MGDIAKLIGAAWKELSEEEKASTATSVHACYQMSGAGAAYDAIYMPMCCEWPVLARRVVGLAIACGARYRMFSADRKRGGVRLCIPRRLPSSRKSMRRNTARGLGLTPFLPLFVHGCLLRCCSGACVDAYLLFSLSRLRVQACMTAIAADISHTRLGL